MKTRSRKSSERQSFAELLARVLVEQAEARLENRRILSLLESIASEQKSNYREYHGLTEELIRKARP